jgi:hypothetical protein
MQKLHFENGTDLALMMKKSIFKMNLRCDEQQQGGSINC